MNLFAVAPFFQIDITSLATALAAVGALAYAKRQITLAREGAKIDLAFRLYEHQLNPEFARHVAMAADFITIETEQEPEREAIAIRRWRRWSRMGRGQKAEILLYLNHLEVVGNLHELGRIDDDAAKEFFGTAALEYWKRGDWFISRIQKGSPSSFTGWGRFAAVYLESNPKQPDLKPKREGLPTRTG